MGQPSDPTDLGDGRYGGKPAIRASALPPWATFANAATFDSLCAEASLHTNGSGTAQFDQGSRIVAAKLRY
jgi:hypothetical protein